MSAATFGRDVFVDRELGVAFPESIASLTFRGIQKYDDAKLGYSPRYQNEDLVKADLYVYDNGYKDIKDGISSEMVQGEFAEILGAFSIMQKMGKYKEVKELAKETKTYGPQKRAYLWARYGYRQAPGEGVLYHGDRISETYLIGIGGLIFSSSMLNCSFRFLRSMSFCKLSQNRSEFRNILRDAMLFLLSATACSLGILNAFFS